MRCGAVRCSAGWCGAVRFGPGALNHNLLTKSCPTSSHVDCKSVVSIDRSKEGTFSQSTQGGVFVILCLAGASFHIADNRRTVPHQPHRTAPHRTARTTELERTKRVPRANLERTKSAPGAYRTVLTLTFFDRYCTCTCINVLYCSECYFVVWTVTI